MYHNSLKRELQSVRKCMIQSGEMSEWLKEHAWKAKRASDINPP